jgi:S-adenosylmethionine decarboxylase proenzyme, Bacillus form
MIVGTEWLIEAAGCSKEALRDEPLLRSIFSSIIDDLQLKIIGEVFWHKFEGEGGVTGLAGLTESHLTCHTYPEHGLATFNLYCCRERREWDWEGKLHATLKAESVSVQKIERGNLKSRISDFKSEAAGGDA